MNLKSLRDYSLRTKLGVIMVMFSVIALINYASIVYYKNLLNTDTAVIDAAGRQRMLTQRIAFLSEQKVDGKNEILSKLKNDVQLCDTILHTLRHGGTISGVIDTSIPATSDEVMPTLDKAEDLWKEFEKNVLVIVEIDEDASSAYGSNSDNILVPEIYSALDFIESKSDEMLLRFDNLVFAYLDEGKKRQSNLNSLLVLLGVLNLLILALGIVVINRYIRKPILEISHYLNELSDGNLNNSASYVSKDEIGQAISNLGKLNSNLGNASSFAVDIGQGNFERNFEATSENDQLGQALIEMRDRLRDISKEDQKRQWTTEGHVKFGTILRENHENLEMLTDHALRFFVDYFKTNQGVIYILSDEDTFLEAIAYYAWKRKKFLESKVMPGQGIVGAVFLEKETSYLKQIPDDYVKITSGLGEANPGSILVVPIKLNDEVCGVIELASFNDFEPHHIELIEQLAESLASEILNAKTNYKTRQLLQQTQQQTEEMKSQEEEMRQNMEELSATQEEMRRKEQEYLKKIKDLES